MCVYCACSLSHSTAHAPSLTLKNQYILDSTTPHKQETFDILPDFIGSSKPWEEGNSSETPKTPG